MKSLEILEKNDTLPYRLLKLPSIPIMNPHYLLESVMWISSTPIYI